MPVEPHARGFAWNPHARGFAGPSCDDPRVADNETDGGTRSDAVAEIRAMLMPYADATRATQMAAYMKGIAPYLGLSSPQRRSATMPWIRAFDPGPEAVDLLTTAEQLVREPEREFAYVAIDLVARHQRSLPSTALPSLRSLALHQPWWDTVDPWAASVIGRTALRHPGWDPEIAGWASDEQLWARRIALVFQVGRRDAVDMALLFAACEVNLGERNFFMRKGIGWALRDAARTRPDEIRTFVAAHRDAMSGLSVREAMKHL